MVFNVLDGYVVYGYVYGYDYVYDYVYYYDVVDIKVFGFWVYLMSDLIIFVLLFVMFCVLCGVMVGGLMGKEFFDLLYVVIEIGILLVLFIIYGMVMISL